jgi:hypothetical protein
MIILSSSSVGTLKRAHIFSKSFISLSESISSSTVFLGLAELVAKIC